MNSRIWITRLLLISLMLFALAGVLLFSRARSQPSSAIIASNPDPNIAALSSPKIQFQSDKQQKIPQPTPTPSVQTTANVKPKVETPTTIQASKPQNPVKVAFQTTAAFKAYKPKYLIAWANATNYGERFTQDANGVAVNNEAIVVLHETSNSAYSAVNTFQNFHEDSNDQTSYHTLITLDGTVVYLVPPDKRAFGAGNSVFDGPNGSETVQTNPNLPPSVNNFAYHVSLETPPDGWSDKNSDHSGYTVAQYNSLAWLIAQSQVPENRITTHKAVDRSGQRIDPRSFDFPKFFNLLSSYRQMRVSKG
jgi:N-acetylmuramoyl-L-alanine amidase